MQMQGLGKWRPFLSRKLLSDWITQNTRRVWKNLISWKY